MTSIPPQGPPQGPPVWSAPGAAPSASTAPTAAQVEWQLVEHVPGDPWSTELVIWSGDAIDGIAVPLDEELLAVLAEVRRRRGDLDATFDDAPLPAAGRSADAAEGSGDDALGSRLGRWWHGLGRTTGSSQADRWLENVPVKWQLAGAGILLLVFVLVMVIGRLL